ncbi:MAG: FAD:protein FMN transferase [Phycisphaerae bacterium]|nr:FAD:protein FMN transferase [Phycisphaerae bacterium]
MTARAPRWLGGLAVALLAGVTGLAVWMTHRPARRLVARREPAGVMGTETHLMAVGAPDGTERLGPALDAAEAALRRVEARMSRHIAASEIGRLNTAGAGQLIGVSPETTEVLRRSRALWGATGGAFDVTCLPLLRLWAKARRAGRVPSPDELAAARAASRWADFSMVNNGVLKHRGSACVDLGGIAKGWAIDAAAEAMRDAGAVGGLIDVGGDLRCFGRPPEGGRWLIAVRNPFGGAPIAELRLSGGAVCTSAHYARGSTVAGVRYSHIVNPRDGRALRADRAPASVTVVAPEATAADVWATALSVLGTDGLARLPDGVEAMVVTGSPDDYNIRRTPGLEPLLVSPTRAPDE